MDHDSMLCVALSLSKFNSAIIAAHATLHTTAVQDQIHYIKL